MNQRANIAKLKGLRRSTVELQERSAMRADGALEVCAVFGCARPPAARAGKGLSLFYCRRCCQSANRHGCHWKKTYSAATLQPYRKAAQHFIKAHPSDIWIVAALHALDCLMAHSGPVERIVDVNEMAPRAKARVALARLRRAEVAPERLLMNYLAVCGAIAEDAISPGSESLEYRRTQTAKAIFRISSGYHAVYGPGSRYDRYPRSAGLALRHLGEMLDEACEHVREAHLGSVLALKGAQTAASQGGHHAVTH